MIDRIAWGIVAVVVAVWVVTTLVLPFVIGGYSPPASVGAVMGSLAGGAAAYLFAKRGSRDGGKRAPRLPKKRPRSEKDREG